MTPADRAHPALRIRWEHSFRSRATPYAEYTPEEVGSRGEAIYEQKIRSKVDPEHKGKFLVLDVETGQYEIDEDDAAASRRALAKRRDAVLYGLRIGHPTAYRLGGYVGTGE